MIQHYNESGKVPLALRISNAAVDIPTDFRILNQRLQLLRVDNFHLQSDTKDVGHGKF